MTNRLLRRVTELEAARPMVGAWHRIMLLPGQSLADALAKHDGPQVLAEDHLVIRTIVEAPVAEGAR